MLWNARANIVFVFLFFFFYFADIQSGGQTIIESMYNCVNMVVPGTGVVVCCSGTMRYQLGPFTTLVEQRHTKDGEAGETQNE